MSITYKLTATETCEERDKIIRTREFKTCTGLNLKPGPGPGPPQDRELRPVSGPGPPEKAKARPVQASVTVPVYETGGRGLESPYRHELS